MKITIAHTDSESRQVGLIVAFVKGLVPSIKVKESDRHAPYKHIYLATRKPGTVDGQADS